jgi:uncharacterized membrane protein
MASPSLPSQFSGHTNILIELFIAALTLLPFVVLSYFYSSLPQQIPEYLHLNGEVAVWGRKSLFSVFRLALMGLDLQLLAILMKYGLWQRYVAQLSQPADGDRFASESLRLMAGLTDWLRVMAAIKLFVSAIEVIFLTNERFTSLAAAARAISWISSILGVLGAAAYFYRALRLKRRMPPELVKVKPLPSQTRVHGGVFYYNSADPSLFVEKYLFNFAHPGAYVFLLCLLSLPLLMFLPMLTS